MRFQVPQFLEVEDKIFGPFTFKQFIYLAGSIAIAVVMLMLLPKFIALLLGAPIVAFGVALAFYRVNEKPFINVVEAFLKFQLGGKLYLWSKEDSAPIASTNNPKQIDQVYVPRLSESKLKDLSWSLDIKDNTNPVTKENATTDLA